MSDELENNYYDESFEFMPPVTFSNKLERDGNEKLQGILVKARKENCTNLDSRAPSPKNSEYNEIESTSPRLANQIMNRFYGNSQCKRPRSDLINFFYFDLKLFGIHWRDSKIFQANVATTPKLATDCLASLMRENTLGRRIDHILTLLDYGADCNISIDSNQDSLLHYFIKANSFRGVKKVISLNIDVNRRNNMHQSPLMLACTLQEDKTKIDIIRCLLTIPKLDPYLRDQKQNNAMMLAILRGNMLVVRELLLWNIRVFHEPLPPEGIPLSTSSANAASRESSSCSNIKANAYCLIRSLKLAEMASKPNPSRAQPSKLRVISHRATADLNSQPQPEMDDDETALDSKPYCMNDTSYLSYRQLLLNSLLKKRTVVDVMYGMIRRKKLLEDEEVQRRVHLLAFFKEEQTVGSAPVSKSGPPSPGRVSSPGLAYPRRIPRPLTGPDSHLHSSTDIPLSSRQSSLSSPRIGTSMVNPPSAQPTSDTNHIAKQDRELNLFQREPTIINVPDDERRSAVVARWQIPAGNVDGDGFTSLKDSAGEGEAGDPSPRGVASARLSVPPQAEEEEAQLQGIERPCSYTDPALPVALGWSERRYDS